MTRRKKPTDPFLDAEDARTLGAVVNRFAAFFDAKKLLSLPEARVVFVLLARMMGALLDAYPKELEELMSKAEQMKDEDPDPTKWN